MHELHTTTTNRKTKISQKALKYKIRKRTLIKTILLDEN